MSRVPIVFCNIWFLPKRFSGIGFGRVDTLKWRCCPVIKFDEIIVFGIALDPFLRPAPLIGATSLCSPFTTFDLVRFIDCYGGLLSVPVKCYVLSLYQCVSSVL
ncbi:unnamed protein product [Dracunculus medinensis]|uniref:Secreted protein n=1 Tax=Dracunculus medinensis TaxID=318479 RepID=A0A0N4U2D9_DRAME|nr:unnamed protein product [Dracunculus medinensis]